MWPPWKKPHQLGRHTTHPSDLLPVTESCGMWEEKLGALHLKHTKGASEVLTMLQRIQKLPQQDAKWHQTKPQGPRPGRKQGISLPDPFIYSVAIIVRAPSHSLHRTLPPKGQGPKGLALDS